MEVRLGPGGGVLKDFVMAEAGVGATDAEALLANMFSHIRNPMPTPELQRERAMTAPLVEGAVARQAQDIGRMIEAIVRYSDAL